MTVLIKSINCALLCVILIGVPAIAGIRFGTIQISSIAKAQGLVLWGLSLAALANTCGALCVVKERKNRRLCWYWAFAFAGLLGLEYALAQGYLNFDWLKQGLIWLQENL